MRRTGPLDSTAVVEELAVDGLDFDLPRRKRSRNVGVPARDGGFCYFIGEVKSVDNGFE